MAQPQVVIVGGGPAGMATALGLAKNNVPCTVICQPTGNTYKPGETVPPNITTILHKLELKDIFNSDNHLHCYGNRFVWGNDEPVDKSFFTTPSSHGWHINRVLFEKELQQTAQQRDIPIIYATVTDCQWENNRWTLQYSDNEGTTLTLAAPFLVDATGRASKMVRAMGMQRNRLDTLTAVWTVLKLKDFEHPQYTYIEARPDGWWYAAPLQGERLGVGFFTDADLLDKNLLDFSFFSKKTATTTMIKDLLKNGQPEQPPGMYPVPTTYLQRRHGQTWLAVGDTALAYDPLSSYGIISALEGGYYAGHAITEHLNGREEALPAYDMLITQAFDLCNTMRINQYGLETRWKEKVFWGRRR